MADIFITSLLLQCYSSSQLLTIAGNEKGAMGNMILTEAGLIRICPALLQQHVSKACIEEHVETPPAAVPLYTEAKSKSTIILVCINPNFAFRQCNF